MSVPTTHPQPQPQYTMTSASAVSSMIFGIAATLSMCSILASVITSLLAIVIGHISLSKIKKNNGRLVGKGFAIAGLVLGYILFPLSLTFAMLGFSNARNNPQMFAGSLPDGPAAEMRDAESELVGLFKGGTAGNNGQAEDLAKSYGKILTTLIQATIVREKRGVEKKVDDEVSVICRLHDDTVCFLVKIPGYRNYNDEAKEGLAKMAWQAGRMTVGDSLPEGTEMGIGLKGLFLYGAVMIDDAQSEDPSSNTKSKDLLVRFFEDPLDEN